MQEVISSMMPTGRCLKTNNSHTHSKPPPSV